jgi:hypothetical protein
MDIFLVDQAVFFQALSHLKFEKQTEKNMGFIKGGITVSRFKISGGSEIFDDIDGVCHSLHGYRFRPIEGAAEQSQGWALFDTPFDDEHSLGFCEDTVLFDNYLAFCLRVDRKRIPGSVKKIEVDKAIRAEKATSGAISKARKLEIKESVLLRLLARATAVPSSVEVLVDREGGVIYVATGQAKTLGLLQELMNSTFSDALELEPINACAAVERRLELENQNPFAAIQRKDQAVDFLGETGNMFLTWLWFRDGRDMGGQNGIPVFSLYLDRKLAAASEVGSVSVTASAAMEGGLEVAKKAIFEGRKIYSARAVAVQDGELFFDVVLTNELALSGIKLPKVQIESDSVDVDEVRLATLLLRIDLLKRLCSFVDAAFEEFLDAAMDERRWAQVQAQITEWAGSEEV